MLKVEDQGDGPTKDPQGAGLGGPMRAAGAAPVQARPARRRTLLRPGCRLLRTACTRRRGPRALTSS